MTLQSLQAYGNSFQTKVIGALLTQQKFLINVSDNIDPTYWESPASQWIIDYILRYFNIYHTYPTMEALAIENKKIENDILKISITETLREAYKLAQSKDIEYVENEFTNFCKNQQVKKAIMNSVDLLGLGDFDGIRHLINNALKSENDKNIGHEYNLDMESRYRDDDRRPVPFPWKVFNDMTQGGMGKGDLILIPGNPGGGKSWVVTAIGAYAAYLGINVFHYTLELSEGYVGKRYDSIFSGIDIDKLNDNKDKVKECVDRIKGKIIIKEYPPKNASYETFKAHMRQVKTTQDIEPGIIIIDYIDYVKTPTRKDRNEELDDVYIGGKSLAKELGLPILSPVQANRTGAKNKILEGDNLAGNYSKLMIADMVLSLARTRKDKIHGTGRFHWMKNRFGPDGLTYSSRINTSKGYIEIDEQPLDDDENEPTIQSKMMDDKKLSLDDKEYLRHKFFEQG